MPNDSKENIAFISKIFQFISSLFVLHTEAIFGIKVLNDMKCQHYAKKNWGYREDL